MAPHCAAAIAVLRRLTLGNPLDEPCHRFEHSLRLVLVGRGGSRRDGLYESRLAVIIFPIGLY